jgi:hypothetical protein
MAYVVTVFCQQFVPQSLSHIARRTESGTPERDVVGVEKRSRAASLCVKNIVRQIQSDGFREL